MQDPKDLINWVELSRYLANNESSVSRTRCPNKYQDKVNALIESIERWANVLLPTVFLSTKDKQEQFHKELKALLVKYKAELTIENFGRNWADDEKIVVDFEFDESFFEKEDTGIVPQLVIGRWENGR